MKLDKKKQLAVRTLGVGLGRIIFNNERLNEIKEAITKQDIKDLYESGAISIREIKGRKKIERRKTKRGPGSVKKKVKPGKQGYVKLTRKLRRHLTSLKQKNQITKEQFIGIRKEIKASSFRSLAHMKERFSGETKK
ncbi:hypothetical protein J4408_02270 [Candidatus Pacearchaeota archaeon]|nr:hypothetical protein [Candidatus Pacearchaeota archaeon]